MIQLDNVVDAIHRIRQLVHFALHSVPFHYLPEIDIRIKITNRTGKIHLFLKPWHRYPVSSIKKCLTVFSVSICIKPSILVSQKRKL